MPASIIVFNPTGTFGVEIPQNKVPESVTVHDVSNPYDAAFTYVDSGSIRTCIVSVDFTDFDIDGYYSIPWVEITFVPTGGLNVPQNTNIQPVLVVDSGNRDAKSKRAKTSRNNNKPSNSSPKKTAKKKSAKKKSPKKRLPKKSAKARRN